MATGLPSSLLWYRPTLLEISNIKIFIQHEQLQAVHVPVGESTLSIALLLWLLSCRHHLYLAAVCQQLAQHLRSVKVLEMGSLLNLCGKKWGYSCVNYRRRGGV